MLVGYSPWVNVRRLGRMLGNGTGWPAMVLVTLVDNKASTLATVSPVLHVWSAPVLVTGMWEAVIGQSLLHQLIVSTL